jgi:glycosyltransferase involved in cell wall biosynthesis
LKQSLLIVSASPMRSIDGENYIFEPTLREIEHLTNIFDSITWIGVSDPTITTQNSRTDQTGKIKFIILPTFGGQGIFNRLKLVVGVPLILGVILKNFFSFKYIHNRAPSLPTIISIFLGFIFPNKRIWSKYAGNWVQKNPPLGYKMQIIALKKAHNSFVAVNGSWPEMPSHIHAFENPCFSIEELNKAFHAGNSKNYHDKINILMVGRIEEEKGVGRIIRALHLLPIEKQKQINQITFIGKGKDYESLLIEANEKLNIPFEFVGSLKRDELDEKYAMSHIFCLPSNASEGFPKVIAEAAAFSNALIVSDVSSVAQYVENNIHGIVISDLSPEVLASAFERYIDDRELLSVHAKKASEIPKLFTYERYNNRVITEIFPELAQ